jgi:hypothetical protein
MNAMSIQGIQNNAASGSGEFTTSAPEAAPVPAQPNEVEFWAMPGPGQTLQGLRRGALYCLWKDGEIETVSCRRRGRSRGRRLIVASTLRNYLRRLRNEQCAPASKERAE